MQHHSSRWVAFSKLVGICLQIRNVSTTMRRLRIIPPASQLFHVTQCAYPTSSGLIAPGMAASAIMRFTPDTRANARDALTVDTELSRFEVALRAERAPPALSLPQQLDAGAVYLGSALAKHVTVECSGTDGAFMIVPAADWPPSDGGAVNVESRDVVHIGECFELSPAQFDVEAGCSVDLSVAFHPKSTGIVMLNVDA